MGESGRHCREGWGSGEGGQCPWQTSSPRAASAGGSGGLGMGAAKEVIGRAWRERAKLRPFLHWVGGVAQMAASSWPWRRRTSLALCPHPSSVGFPGPPETSAKSLVCSHHTSGRGRRHGALLPRPAPPGLLGQLPRHLVWWAFCPSYSLQIICMGMCMHECAHV